MGKSIKIPGRLESVETGNIVAGANAIKDDTRGKTQVVVNNELEAAILTLAEGKQNVLTFDQTPTENSTNPVTSGGVYAADQVLSQAIEAILLLIPSAASSLNKLVDLATMNSSIATATASFKGTYNLVSDLHLGVDATHAQIAAALDALSLDADNNDYAFVQVPNTDTAPTEIKKTERYKFNGTNWAYEYDLNNSGFTSAQWNAINSGITMLLVSKLSALPTNDALVAALAAKQDNLTFDNVPTAGSNNPVKSSGIYTRNNEIVELINALDAAKQNVLTFDTTPTSGSTNPVTSNGIYLAIQLVQTAVVALDGRMSTAETKISTAETNIVNLQAAYAALTQSDIVVVEGALPSTGQQQNVIYRQPDPDHTPPQFYSDYMWNGTAWVLMATYNNAIDDVPTAGSHNLVKSGGVFISDLLNSVKDPNAFISFDGNDADLFIHDMYWTVNDNQLVLDTGRKSTDYFEVSEGVVLAYSNFRNYPSTYAIVAFDANKDIIPNACFAINGSPASGSYTVGEGVKYIVVSIPANRTENPLFEFKNILSTKLDDNTEALMQETAELDANTGNILLYTNKKFLWYSILNGNAVKETGTNRMRSNMIPVKEGDAFLYSLRNTSSVYSIAALDANGDIVQGKSIVGDDHESYRFYVVPSGISYLIFCNYGTYLADPFVKKMDSNYFGDNEVKRSMQKSDFDINGVWIPASNEILIASSYVSKLLKAEGVASIHYKAEYSGGSSISYLVVFDSEFNVLISKAGGAAANEWLTIPDNAAYVLISIVNNYYSNIEVFTGNQHQQNAKLALNNRSLYIDSLNDFASDYWTGDANKKESTTTNRKLGTYEYTSEDNFCFSACLTGYGTAFDIHMGKRTTYISLAIDNGTSYVRGYGIVGNSVYEAFSQQLANVVLESGKKIYVTIIKNSKTAHNQILYTIEVSDGYGNKDVITKYYPDFGLTHAWGELFFNMVSGTKMEVSGVCFGYNISPYSLVSFFGHSYVEGDSLRNVGINGRWAALAADEIGLDKCEICGMAGSKWPDLLDRLNIQLSWMSGMKYAVFYEGLNDLYTEIQGGMSASTLQQVKDYTKLAADVCISHDVLPIFATINATKTGYVNDREAYNSWLINESGYKVFDVRSCFLNSDGTIDDNAFMEDGVHPTVEAHQRIFNILKLQCPYLFNM